jgi:predicted amidohydrolase YtcJ
LADRLVPEDSHADRVEWATTAIGSLSEAGILFRVPVDRISRTKVLMTMLGGNVVHGDLDLRR